MDQGEIFALQDAFHKLDVDDRGYLDEASVIKATQQSERQPYDVVRQTLKGVELDSSRRVELEDYIDVSGHHSNQRHPSARRLRHYSWSRGFARAPPQVPQVAPVPRR